MLVLTGEPLPSQIALAVALTAGVVGLIGIAALYRVLADGRMSIGSPLVAVIGAGLPVLAAFLFGERLPASDIVGIGLALVAVVLVSIPSRSAPTEDGHLDLRLLGLAVLAGSCIGLFSLFLDRAAAEGAGPWWILTCARATTVAVVFLALAVRRPARPAALDKSLLAIIAIGLGDLAGNFFFLASNAEGSLSVAVILSSLYPVTTILLASVVLHERLRGGQLVGVLAALAGIVLIAI